MKFAGEDGWPADVPPGLEEAIRALPGFKLSRTQLDFAIRLLIDSREEADALDHPNNRSLSRSTNEDRLWDLHARLEAILPALEALPREACDALFKHGVSIQSLTRAIRAAIYAVPMAVDDLEAPERHTGRPPQDGTKDVVMTAAYVFELVTGQRPSYTTLPDSTDGSGRHGPWPDFLRVVLKCLHMPGSADSLAAWAVSQIKGGQS